MSEPGLAAQSESRKLLQINHGPFILLILLVVGGAILRSAIATRLDDFTFDEPTILRRALRTCSAAIFASIRNIRLS